MGRAAAILYYKQSGITLDLPNGTSHHHSLDKISSFISCLSGTPETTPVLLRKASAWLVANSWLEWSQAV